MGDNNICVGIGTACSSNASKKKKNRILNIISPSLNEDKIKSFLRISFWESNTLSDVKLLANKLTEIYFRYI